MLSVCLSVCWPVSDCLSVSVCHVDGENDDDYYYYHYRLSLSNISSSSLQHLTSLPLRFLSATAYLSGQPCSVSPSVYSMFIHHIIKCFFLFTFSVFILYLKSLTSSPQFLHPLCTTGGRDQGIFGQGCAAGSLIPLPYTRLCSAASLMTRCEKFPRYSKLASLQELYFCHSQLLYIWYVTSYSRPKFFYFFALSQTKLLKNPTLHSGTYLYTLYMGVPLPCAAP